MSSLSRGAPSIRPAYTHLLHPPSPQLIALKGYEKLPPLPPLPAYGNWMEDHAARNDISGGSCTLRISPGRSGSGLEVLGAADEASDAPLIAAGGTAASSAATGGTAASAALSATTGGAAASANTA
ncbi:hypothetical protein G5714_013106 [Onychostoma macrolepis]|uniref:Uncharacterized protein n=1 Tax=Onychostoma macrolepis TaxID=369639 RepID=A0A7J6CED8_9TELE|nr:hypothetical protein G5714_013106 [Onychostoma macrolepis]